MSPASSVAPLTTQDLRLALPQHQQAAPISWTLQAGECWALLGPNGAGKTTLLQTLAGLQSPAQGQIHLGGEPITRYKARARARQIGLVFQQQQDAFPVTLTELAAMSRFAHQGLWGRTTQADQQAVDLALTQLALQPLRQRLVTQLSGGERQRLALACLMIQDPAIWLIDEPCNHLDLRFQVQILHLLQQQTQRALVMSLHDLNLALRFCSHLFLLYPDGRACWGAKEAMLNLSAFEDLYQQSFKMHQIDDHWQLYPLALN